MLCCCEAMHLTEERVAVNQAECCIGTVCSLMSRCSCCGGTARFKTRTAAPGPVASAPGAMVLTHRQPFKHAFYTTHSHSPIRACGG